MYGDAVHMWAAQSTLGRVLGTPPCHPHEHFTVFSTRCRLKKCTGAGRCRLRGVQAQTGARAGSWQWSCSELDELRSASEVVRVWENCSIMICDRNDGGTSFRVRMHAVRMDDVAGERDVAGRHILTGGPGRGARLGALKCCSCRGRWVCLRGFFDGTGSVP